MTETSSFSRGTPMLDTLTTGTALKSWPSTRREWWKWMAPPCVHRDCTHASTFWRRLRPGTSGAYVQGSWYCGVECLERALFDALRQGRSSNPRPAPSAHRLPLGLLLLSRQQLTVEQLRVALAAQHSAGRGRIGEWLQSLGFVTEQQVTAALARQWSCPVFRTDHFPPASSRGPQIPALLLDLFLMLPVDFVAATATLHIAFAEAIDYGILYAIEQMLECRTAPCMARPSALRQGLRAFTEPRGQTEVVFDRVSDCAEFARIVRSYVTKLAASEIRLAVCGSYTWVRLQGSSRRQGSSGRAVDLLLRTPADALAAVFVPPVRMAMPAF